ncbi:NPCBM/NEW2 domain-containing protein [Streptomyces sp. NRRL F-5123]|uniref:NPCBM/NEW2 domain-containing protein n=1 Tax=Streptomyces sp. NRRL F-5123 TaxID=1463856 RepID=UPI0004E1FAD0|nr:NPCBM/NEW2 domain-containing protein [Streptomyces sp. NRRL F-5123]
MGVTNPPPPSGVNDVSDIDFASATNGWGPVERDRSDDETGSGVGKPITIGGTVHAKGLGVNAPSEVAIDVRARCTRVEAHVGVDDETGGKGSVTITVLGDGKPLSATQFCAAARARWT